MQEVQAQAFDTGKAWPIDSLVSPATQSSSKLEALIGDNDFTKLNENDENDFYRVATRPVGRLAFEQIGNGSTSYCTGALVDDDIVLTNAHCVVDIRGQALNRRGVIVMEFLDAIDTSNTETFELDVMNLIEVGEVAGKDYALLRVLRGMPGRKYGTITLSRETPRAGISLFIGHHAEGGVKVLSAGGQCKTVAVRQGDLFHSCDTFRGSSGSPVFLLQPANKMEYSAIAIHTRAVDSETNGAELLTDIVASSPTLSRIMLSKSPNIYSAGDGASSSTQKKSGSLVIPKVNETCTVPPSVTGYTMTFDNGFSLETPSTFSVAQNRLFDPSCDRFQVEISKEPATPSATEMAEVMKNRLRTRVQVDGSYQPVFEEEGYFIFIGTSADSSFYQVGYVRGGALFNIRIAWPVEWGDSVDALIGKMACSLKFNGDDILRCGPSSVKKSCRLLQGRLSTYVFDSARFLAPVNGVAVSSDRNTDIVYADCAEASVSASQLSGNFDEMRAMQQRDIRNRGWWIDPSYGPSRPNRGYSIFTGEAGNAVFYDLATDIVSPPLRIQIFMPKSFGKLGDEITGKIACSVTVNGRSVLPC